MKVTSLVFTSTLLFGSTIAQADDFNAAIQVDPAVPLPALQATPTLVPSSSFYESVWAKVSAGINTECKTCPNSLCSNKNFYGSLLMFRATCWTIGQKINATDMWLQSEEGCYVTVQDTLKYWRNYTQDLKPCENVPERAAPRRMTARAATECRRCPNDKCETVRSYGRRSEVPITCRAQALPECMEHCLPSDIPQANETTIFPWYKTTSNCYIKSTSLSTRRKRQARTFEDCGPVPYLDFSYRAPAPAPPTTVTVTTTLTMWYPTTTTVILRQNPCAGPNCPPLIWAYTPPAVIPTSSPPVTLTPTSSPGVTLTPTSTGGITLTPTSTGGITLTPTSTGGITLTPTSTGGITLTPTSTGGITLTPSPISNTTISPTSTTVITITSTSTPIVIITPTSTTIITLTPTTSPGTTIPNTPITPPTFSTNLTLAPITLGREQTSDPPPSFTITISFPSSSPPSSTTSTTSPGVIIVPTSNPIITLTPTSNPIITLTPTNNPGITLTPTNNPGITLTPTNNPGITLTPTNDPGITLTPTSIDPITFTQTLTLPPITLRSVVTDAVRAHGNHNSTRPAKCSCSPYPCKGDSDAQAMCSAIAVEKCSKTCSSASAAAQTEPFQPLMSEGGRPPPGENATPGHAASIRVKLDDDCKCAPMKCPESGDEADACRLVYIAACSMDCGQGTPATKVVYGGSTVLIITQLISPTAAAVV